MYSASEAFAAIQTKKLENDESLTILLQQQIKSGRNWKDSWNFYLEVTKKELDYDAIPFQPNLEADDDDLMDDDRDLNINRPIDKSSDVQDRTIAESSGTQPNVDQSLLDHNLNTATPLIVDITQPQHVIQQENMDVDLTKSSKQKKKSNKNLVKNVITGHIPTDDDTSRVRDILVYDIPVSWTPEDILKELTLWGKTISLQMKPQRKYQTLRLKIELSTFQLAQFEINEDPVWTTDLGGIPVRWFPARWTLKERKQREKFQATIHKIPDSMTLAALWTDRRPHSFLSAIKGLKSFKIIQTARGERKLLGFFERWVDMRAALENQVIWENYNLSWNRHAPPTQPTRSHGDKANKNRNRTSRSQKTEKTQQNSKNSKKKPKETTSKKPDGQKNKKDKSRSKSKDKVLAEILDLLRKLV
ncbi:hypothetical protein RirG_150030 [Rhizophagus irregularis DAOM 197198w]|uniref:Uncharacterized protein n=1 Tax=Rhizophagus irregularis (strain DAOM 197198w) TaxID=1432141 RepID=A0A015K873_RHIIW|nr:hypothetical protein RirG_150030 [Rhizophagus irregularis DAOM 197198w]